MKIIVFYIDGEIENYTGDYTVLPTYLEIRKIIFEDNDNYTYIDIVIPMAQIRKLEID